MVSIILNHVNMDHFIAGLTGGLVSTLILHPLDLIKVRMQVDEGSSSATARKEKVVRPKYHGFVDALKKIYGEGGVRALYQGVKPSLIGAGLSWGLYFLIYDSLRSYYQQGDSGKQLSSWTYMQNATLAGVFTSILVNPIWVMKTRLCLQYKQDRIRYDGVFSGMVKIARDEGPSALYRGLLLSLFGTLHGTIQFGAYEYLKQLYRTQYSMKANDPMNTVVYAVFSSLSKILATTALYPHQVIKSRLQQQHRRYNGTVHAIIDLIRNEGIQALYKGILPTILRVTPASCITFVVYETIANALRYGGPLVTNASKATKND